MSRIRRELADNSRSQLELRTARRSLRSRPVGSSLHQLMILASQRRTVRKRGRLGLRAPFLRDLHRGTYLRFASADRLDWAPHLATEKRLFLTRP